MVSTIKDFEEAVILEKYKGSPRSTQPDKENPKNLEKSTFNSQRSFLLSRHTFPNDVQ